MELTKFKAAEVSYHIKHDLRELPEGKSYGNESIDRDLSFKNYSLIDRGKNATEVNKYRKKIEKEVFKYNRKDVVHAVEVCIQCPNDCPAEQKEMFFIESYKYITSTLPMGERCVFVAQVHKDEKHYSPTGELISKDHLHIMYVPAVLDSKHDGFNYKLCADQLTKRAKLKALHPGLQEHLDNCGIQATVYRKKEGDGKQISLSVNELKKLTAATGITIDKGLTVEDLANIINSNIEYEKRVETLTSIIHDRNRSIEILNNNITENKALKELIYRLQETVKDKENELIEAREKIKYLENQKIITEAKAWGNDNSWGSNTHNWGQYDKEEEKTW